LTNHAEEMLQRGSALLAPLLLRHGFSFEILDAGSSSGGHFASGEFKRGTRRLGFHFRHSLGIVTYSLADRSMTHQQSCVSYTAALAQATTRDSQTIHSMLFGICFLIWSSTVVIFSVEQMNAFFVALTKH
jgi:hypothetical protein